MENGQHDVIYRENAASAVHETFGRCDLFTNYFGISCSRVIILKQSVDHFAV